MVAVDKKTNRPYQVVKYTLKVLERGSDTDFGKSSMTIYLPESRTSVEVSRNNYTIYDNWAQVSHLEWDEDED